MKGIIQYLVENPRPSDEEIHQWAEDNGYTPEEVEEYLYALIATVAKKLSKSVDEADDKYDAAQLERGIEVEKEHTDNEDIAKMIAKDHLNELSDYYTRLTKMEKEGKSAAHVAQRITARLQKFGSNEK